jgi:hypothetical protein
MGKLYEELAPQLIRFIEAQKMFFVGKAPLSESGHVNISPKGVDSLRVLDARTLAYLDVTGSGVETISHIKENGRLVMMFCAFEGNPLFPGIRSVIRLHATRIADSCGWTVPSYDFVGTRDYYDNYAEKIGAKGLREGQLAANMLSIDGLEGLEKPSI